MISTRAEHQVLICAAQPTLDAAAVEQLNQLLQSELDWEYLLGLAEKHCVVPLLYQQLNESGVEQIPARALARLQAANHQNTNTTLLLTGELIKLVDLFSERGIPAVPIKGPTLAVRAYGDIGLRQFGDLDILVKPSDVDRIRELLTENAFTAHQTLTSSQQSALQRFDCSSNFISKQGVVLDVHWGLVDRHHGFGIDTEAFFERLEPVWVNGRQLLTLSSENLLLFLCLHGFTHFWERLRWICDVAALVSTSRTIDWNRLLEIARENGVLRILLLGLWLSHDLLAAPLPEDILNAIETDDVIQQIGREVEQQLFAETRDTAGIFSEAALLLRLRERKRDQLKSLISLLGAPRRYDRMFVSFPKSFSFLYYLIRPARLAAKYGAQVLRSPKPDKPLSGHTLGD
jgi:Uncharacterised nucleotidyltransferase